MGKARLGKSSIGMTSQKLNSKHNRQAVLKLQQLRTRTVLEQYPDYGPKSKMTISRIRFGKWMVAYAIYQSGGQPELGRESNGRWMRIKKREEFVTQKNLNL